MNDKIKITGEVSTGEVIFSTIEQVVTGRAYFQFNDDEPQILGDMINESDFELKIKHPKKSIVRKEGDTACYITSIDTSNIIFTNGENTFKIYLERTDA